MSDEPDWKEQQRPVDTYFKACYQIEGSPEVVVSSFEKNQKTAQQIARVAMDTALKDLVRHKIRVSAKSYTVKWQTRTQQRSFAPEVNSNDQVVTGNWVGTFSVVNAAVAKDSEGNFS